MVTFWKILPDSRTDTFDVILSLRKSFKLKVNIVFKTCIYKDVKVLSILFAVKNFGCFSSQCDVAGFHFLPSFGTKSD